MSEVKYRPLMGRVLLRREIIRKTAGGIIVPDSAAKRNAPCKGVIVALGPTAGWTKTINENGDEKWIREISVGQEVVFGRHSGKWLDENMSGTENDKDDAPYYVCSDEDLILAMTEEK